jgi:glycosyltransferase involved in cell wall biosynthesis
MTKSLLTIVILTCNEAHNLPRCLNAIPPRYPVVVLDSGSTDETIIIATKHGSRIYHHDWSGFAAQRNFALEECHISTPWVLFVDADEIYPAKFYDWFEKEIANNDTLDAVMVPSLLFFRDQCLKYAPGYPIYHPRLVRTDKVRFLTNHTGHGESIPETLQVHHASIPYDHYFYNGNLSEWMHKHIGNASKEVNIRATPGAVITLRGRLSMLGKSSILRIPARFFYHYLFCRGFLDGKAGLEYSLMYAWYEATKYVLGTCWGNHKGLPLH